MAPTFCINRLSINKIISFHSQIFLHARNVGIVEIGLIQIFNPIHSESKETKN